VFESIDIPSLVRLRPVPLREVRFIADVHLGRLAAYLRMVGFDTLYEDYYQDEELARTGQNLLRRKANTPDEGPRAPEAKRYRSRLLRRRGHSYSLATAAVGE
jgi:hypothetical protein